MWEAVNNLEDRALSHDDSKLREPELSAFASLPDLSGIEYGSPEYKAGLEKIKPVIQGHYAKNDHHPQHFEDGVNGMSLMALIEMLCDWRAATERGLVEGEDYAKAFMDNFDANFARFNIDPQLGDILRATAKELGLDQN